MVDAEYFRHYLPNQVEELGIATVEVHLHHGGSFKIRRVTNVQDGYVLLEVYTKPGQTEKDNKEGNKPNKTDELHFDRLALPYGSISYVFLTAAEPEEENTIGFQT